VCVIGVSDGAATDGIAESERESVCVITRERVSVCVW